MLGKQISDTERKAQGLERHLGGWSTLPHNPENLDSNPIIYVNAEHSSVCLQSQHSCGDIRHGTRASYSGTQTQTSVLSVSDEVENQDWYLSLFSSLHICAVARA